VLLGFTLALGLALGWMLPRLVPFRSQLLQPLNTATVLHQIQTLSQLVTVKYVMEKVVVLEDVKWYGENRVLLVAHGIVKAGVDLADMTPDDVQLRNRSIVITLPEPAITDAYLDDKQTRVIEHSTGVLRNFDKDLEQNARRQAIDDIRRAARSSGIQEESKDRARAQVQALLTLLGFETVEVRFKR